MELLTQQITAAFDTVAYPGNENLTDSTYGEEPEALVRDFRDKHDWRALDDTFLNEAPEGWGSALSFFSADALRFYLPAYLLADIRGALDTSDPAVRLCMFVTPQAEGKRISKSWGGGTMGDHARKSFAVFDCDQVSAIVAYLWWRQDRDVYNPPTGQALEHYWLGREADCREASIESEPGSG